MNHLDDPYVRIYLNATSISKKLFDVVKTELNQELQQHNLRYQHWFVLKLIHIDQAKNPTIIAETMSINRASVTRLIDELVLHQFIIRDRSSEDRRTINLEITKPGIKVVIAGLNAFRKVPELFKQNLNTIEFDFVNLIETHFIKVNESNY